MPVDHLALLLAVTIRHDGHGGVADDLAEPAGLAGWVRQQERALAEYGFTAYDDGGSGDFDDGGDFGDGGPRAGSRDGSDGRGESEGHRAGPGGGTGGGPGHGGGIAHAHAPADRDGPAFTADGAALAAVVEVRTSVRALFARAVPGAPSKADAGRLPDAGAALDRLNAAAARVPAVHRLAWPADAPPAAEYRAPSGHAPADRLAAALARAGIAFLTGPDLAKLRACPAPRCVRYFVQAHARQEWCKPSCGNRARVARHHARRRALAADDPS